MSRRFLFMCLLTAALGLGLTTACLVRTHPRHGHGHHGVHKGKKHHKHHGKKKGHRKR